jgi:[protein-PII] uridylyltransferase
VVDVFYVTDLLGDKISSATRQAAIKRALLQLFVTADAPEKPAAAAS